MAGIGNCYVADAAASLANPTAAAVFLKAKGATTFATFVKIPGGNILSGKTFLLRASGRATTGTTSNFLAKIQYSSNITAITAATAGSNTDVVTLTNRSYASITRTWSLEAKCMWDSTSLRLTGQFNGVNLETSESAATVITALTAVDLSSETTGFVCAAIFGTGNAGNIAYLDDFSLEVL